MKFRLSLLVCLFATFTAYCQLSDFTLSGAATDETCQGNGKITLQTANTTVGATMLFSLYLLPNTTTPLSQFSQNSISGLVAGNYRIIATQTLGNESNTQQMDFTIVSEVQNLDFEVSSSITTNCDTTGNLQVAILSGSAPFFYEITQGVETRPLQISNLFTELQSGAYTVRVIDHCGNAEVHTFTLQLPSNNLTIGATTFPPVATSCTQIDVFNSVTPSPGSNIIYPITVTYTIHFPAGDQVIVQNYNTGPLDALDLSLTLPLFGNQTYSYDISITDSCNNPPFTATGDIDPNPAVTLSGNPNECGNEYLTVGVSNFSPPYTMNFTAFPSGFSPATLNPAYPGPFTDPGTQFGDDDHTVPLGMYTVEITDSCGRTSSADYEVINVPLLPIVQLIVPTCINPLGGVILSLPENRKIVAATIIAAPTTFPQPLPYAVPSTAINPDTGKATITGLPVGHYFIELVDECGAVYNAPPAEATLVPFTDKGLNAVPKPGCIASTGSVMIRSLNNSSLNTVIITVAPPEFQQPLPYDASAFITPQGVFYMSDLPAGSYKFVGTDNCNLTNFINQNITGYNPGVNNFNINRNCGSFDLLLHDNSNIIGDSYWFQKFNPNTNTWEHPETGTDYPDGTIPDATNSIALTNQTTIFNLTDVGTYRIIKIYQTFDGGSTNCIQKYEEFTYTGSLDILSIFSLDCIGGGGPTSVFLEVLGVPPYQFSITQPVAFDNGNSNIFNNLSSGLYTLKAEDSCGRIALVNVNVGTLLPLVAANAPTPSELLFCGTAGETTASFDLTTLNASILANQPPENYVISYHLSQDDADDNVGALTTPFTNTVNPQTIYVRVEHATLHVCHATTSFRLFVGQTPNLDTTQDNIYVCEGGKTRIFADPGFDVYEWSTGATAPYIDVDTPGVYSVDVKNQYGASFCSNSKSVTVTGSSIATFIGIETQDWTDNRNSFEVLVNGSGHYNYSLDGINYQESNVFENLLAGVYTVFIKDLHGCGIIQQEVVLLNYPKFFTPNGDGYNDKWQIKFAFYEPGMQIYIFDRYGKLLTGFGAESSGWDGTYNGHQMPSTDYWFKVIRVDGTVYRGHFAMKR
ncbi:MAG: T9SS type B sorting domain-containing protein [Flavobacterium sp.]|nr:T9SS type B sorting domain-containing protein [Flavobacterium sp.]